MMCNQDVYYRVYPRYGLQAPCFDIEDTGFCAPIGTVLCKRLSKGDADCMRRHIEVTVMVTPDGAGHYAKCPAFPSIFIYGATVQEALDQVPDAVDLALEFLDENGLPYPVGEDFSINELPDDPVSLVTQHKSRHQPREAWRAKISADLPISV